MPRDSTTIYLIVFAALSIGLSIGALVGWLIGGRKTSALQARCDSYREQHAQNNVALHASEEKCAHAIAEHSQTAQTLAALQSAHNEREKSFAEKIQQLEDMRDVLSKQFQIISQETLDAAQKKFLERANERFKQSEDSADTHIKALLKPVHDQLDKYETSVRTMEEGRIGAFAMLKGQLTELRVDNERVAAAATSLAGVLRDSPKARGNWGEKQLRNVLELCGLSEHVDFETEVHVKDSSGSTLRPDVIIRVPGGQNLIIDAKMSLNDYQNAYEEEDETQRKHHLTAHAHAMKDHVKKLSKKAYWEQFPDAPDFVIMFIPGENFLSAALEQDHQLWDYAFENRVLLATPTNLVAIARTVAAVWRQETLAVKAKEIAEIGRELYKSMAVMGRHIDRLGKNLGQTNTAYNEFIGSLDTNVMTKARRFEDLGIDTGGNNLPSPTTIEQTPRLSSKLEKSAYESRGSLSQSNEE